MVGRRFGYWKVLSRAGRKGYLVCRCVCGVVREVEVGSLRAGRSTSCRCMRVGKLAPRFKHGGRRSAEYRIWSNMKARCYNPANKTYPLYGGRGGRGVRVCASWRNDFALFLADVGARPSAAHSLDRIDNSKGYVSGNVRWTTAKEQARNRRSAKIIEFNGEHAAAIVFAERCGVKASTFTARLRAGWSVGDAVTTPVREWSPGRTKVKVST